MLRDRRRRRRRRQLIPGTTAAIAFAISFCNAISVAQVPPQLRATSEQAQRLVITQQGILNRIDSAEQGIIADRDQLNASSANLLIRSSELTTTIPGFAPPPGADVERLLAALRSYRAEQLRRLSQLAYQETLAASAEACALHTEAERQLRDIKASAGLAELTSKEKAEFATLVANALDSDIDACKSPDDPLRSDSVKDTMEEVGEATMTDP
ncbi:hypothetical protein ASE89_00725 [Sphingomonas sp. Leaf30]|nr:hypothetical protein ASE89_00725 [Sphingomonas sp. Leaf30]